MRKTVTWLPRGRRRRSRSWQSLITRLRCLKKNLKKKKCVGSESLPLSYILYSHQERFIYLALSLPHYTFSFLVHHSFCAEYHQPIGAGKRKAGELCQKNVECIQGKIYGCFANHESESHIDIVPVIMLFQILLGTWMIQIVSCVCT